MPLEAVPLFLLAVAGILLAGNFGEILFKRTGIPDALWLIGAGVLLGPVLHVVAAEQVQPAVPYFGALALIVVLLESGSRLRLPELARTPRAAGLALLGFAVSVVVVAAGSMLAVTLRWLPSAWGWPQALLLGAILGGTSAAILIPALTHARIEPRVAGLLSLEAALADALAVLTVAALVAAAGLAAAGAPDPGGALAARLAIGVGLGILAGLLGLLFLRALRGVSHAYPITLSILLVLFVLIGRAGGDPVAGILAVAVVLGNAPAISRALKFETGVELGEDVRGFHSQLAFVIRAFFFTYVGVSLGGTWQVTGLGFLLAALLLAARWPAVVLATRGSEFTVQQKQVLWAAAPRGMATGVLALLPAGAGLWAAAEIQSLAFAAVVSLLAGFTVALRWVRLPSTVVARPPTQASWSPRPATFAAAPAPVSASETARGEAQLADPFAALSDLFPPPPAGTSVSSPAASEDITNSRRDEDIKPGSGFRW